MKIAQGVALVACPSCHEGTMVRLDTLTANCAKCGNKWNWKQPKLKLMTRPR